MRIVMYRLLTLALAALVALMQPLSRAVVHLAGRLNYWRDQAEIGWLLSVTYAKVQRAGRAKASK